MSAPRPKLLYVDDDVALARLVQKDLQRHGYEVHHAADAEAGLARLRVERYDLVALDHYMPARDGLDVLPEIQALPDAPPVIFVTGAQESALAVAALKAGADDYVVKDLSGDFTALLRAAVAQALEADRLRRAHVQAEAEVRAARDRAEALLREVNHRVGNSLQLVSSFVALQSRQVADESAKAALQDTQARIEAVAQVHRRLYTSADVEAVALDSYLTDLLEQLTSSLSADARGVTISLTSASISVPTDKAVSLGVIVTELVTNAVKYAYPDGPGEIRVRLDAVNDDEAELRVEDDGPGIALDDKPKGGGLGRMIVKAMASSLKSEVCYPEAAGGVARLRFATA